VLDTLLDLASPFNVQVQAVAIWGKGQQEPPNNHSGIERQPRVEDLPAVVLSD
jgi:hypothetical protein